MEGGKLEVMPPGLVHLDTVRALHQTVVSLRTALELSKSELKELKEKYKEQSRCLEHTDIIEQLTIENHILRRKIIDGDSPQNINYSNSPNVEEYSDVYIRTATAEGIEDIEQSQEPQFDNKLEEIIEETSISNQSETSENKEEPKSEVKVIDKANFKTKLELLSKFDVKIKVTTLKEGLSTTTSETDSTIEDKVNPTADTEFEEKREHFEKFETPSGDIVNIRTVSSENIKMAVPSEADSKKDKFDVQVKITSEDNVVVKETTEKAKRKETFNLDVDTLSVRSMSEGDNSVFSEGTTPMENSALDEKQDQENSGNESEEVDDIELIFTTDESKDISNLQEDLVSIRDSDHWTPGSASTHSTPVLIKFHTLDPDFQTGPMAANKSFGNIDQLRMKRVSLPNEKEFKHKGSLDLPGRGILKSFNNKSDNMLYRRSPNASTRRLDSVGSLDHTKSSSFELGSSMDILHREASVDSVRSRFDRFSVFGETDISKCGISEDDLAANLNSRRNTCPNPYQYRLQPSRLSSRTQKPIAGRVRPILRESYGPRREGSAQTDMSALPPRWTSDGYLAYKMSPPPCVVTTLPQRASPARRLTIPEKAPIQRRSDEARRVLLSDIGFTSMVPELSRSAEPLWTLRRAQQSSDNRYTRGSYRSPSASVERSSEWTPHQRHTSRGECMSWRGSLPDVRDDTDTLLRDTETFLRRSIDNLRSTSLDLDAHFDRTGQPYIPGEPKQLRLGHTVKLITPQGRLAVGRVRYVGIAGGTAANSGIVVGAEFSCMEYPGLPRNDGTYRGRRYFLTPPQNTAVFVPFSKIVMAWAN
ncbi:uncharacterized protein LOC125060857 [Pieris napi]|uniref:uncharacterized protein LOC125060857 n=1 Tax=Pieris napi TaxID=78633 RepID=UPI001FBB29B7|nr:uncharacterized protein LOC125060857 [Pieris napi]